MIGLGKIGLPLAVQFAKKGFRVRGLDNNPNVVKIVNSGKVPFPGEKNLDRELAKLIEVGLISAHNIDENVVGVSQVLIVVVPLYVDGQGRPQFESIDNAVRKIGREIKPGSLVCFETTLPIGTTRNRFAREIEKESGLKVGKDVFIAFSPERVFTGRVFEDLGKYPKIVGGLDQASELRAAKFYESVIDFEERSDLPAPNGVWSLGSAESAEFVKLAETTYRDVNIALANQFAIFAGENNMNVEEIIRAANSQPYSHIHNPGIAVGGHCIPIYPHMYLQSDPNAELIRIARNINSNMPALMIEKLIEQHGSIAGSVCGVLGIAYRGGVKESAFSGIHPLVHFLTSYGAEVRVSDPLYDDQEIREMGFTPAENFKDIEILVIQTNHEEYFELSSVDFPKVHTVLDGRGVLDKKNWQVDHFISINGNV